MKLGETFTTGFDVSLQKQGQDVEEEKEKSESPKRQTLLDISPASNRQIIEISTNKEKYNEDISFGNKTKNKRNLNNSSLNDSGDDSYSKEENDIIRKPNILLDDEFVDESKSPIDKSNNYSAVTPDSEMHRTAKEHEDAYNDKTHRRGIASRKSNYSQNNIQIKGKASIKTLIRVAATRK